MDIDVALVPAEARSWPGRVCIVIDELRASSTIVTLLDLGCAELLLTRALEEARRLGRTKGAILAGERRGLTPRGFDYNNSPVELAAAGIRGRTVVLSTSNGTAVLARLGAMPAVLVGCFLNARACAQVAVDLAHRLDVGVGIICAGVLGRFALDDAVAAGVITARLLDALAERGSTGHLTDTATAVLRLQSAYPDVEVALEELITGRLVHRIGAGGDVPFCARVDSTNTVGIVRPGKPLRVERIQPGGVAPT